MSEDKHYCVVCGKEFTEKTKNSHVCSECEKTYLGKKIIGIIKEEQNFNDSVRLYDLMLGKEKVVLCLLDIFVIGILFILSIIFLFSFNPLLMLFGFLMYPLIFVALVLIHKGEYE